MEQMECLYMYSTPSFVQNGGIEIAQSVSKSQQVNRSLLRSTLNHMT